MDEQSTEFLKPVGPTANATAANSKIFNIALAATTNVATDLSGAAYTGLATAISGARYLTLTATVNLWYRWDTATGTVDETTTAASTPANQGVPLLAGQRITEMAPRGATWIIAKATPSAGTLCIQVSSRGAASNIFGGNNVGT